MYHSKKNFETDRSKIYMDQVRILRKSPKIMVLSDSDKYRFCKENKETPMHLDTEPLQAKE